MKKEKGRRKRKRDKGGLKVWIVERVKEKGRRRYEKEEKENEKGNGRSVEEVESVMGE